MNVITKILIALLTVTSCSGASMPAVTVSVAPTPQAQASPTAPPRPEDFPNICDEPEDYCEPCGGVNGPPCPAGMSGPLCCMDGVCVVWDFSHCSGDLGWCFNYTLHETATGIKEAVCHDEEDE